MTDERESFGFDLPDFEAEEGPTAEDILRCAEASVPKGVCPEAWRRAIREFAEKGAVLVKNPDGTITLKARGEDER